MTGRRASPLLVWLALGAVGGALIGAIGVIAGLLPAPDTPPARIAAPVVATLPKPPAPAEPNPYVIRRALVIDHQMKHGDWIWNAKGAPSGPVLVTVDLKAQMMSVFRGGYEIGVAVIEHGADDKPTPLGVFPILMKDAHHRSSLYVGPDGRPAPMDWALRLTPDGVFIHAAKVRPDWASNGCVGVPGDFAEKLFAVAAPGDKVVITDGKVMKIGDALTPG